jgi:hypothetical protein
LTRHVVTKPSEVAAVFFTASADGVNYQTVKTGTYLEKKMNYKLTNIITLPVPRLHLLLPLILNPKK